MSNRNWWPFKLSKRVNDAFKNFKGTMSNSSVVLDIAYLNKISTHLEGLMANSLPDIIERDGLPYFCHVINGWGNGLYDHSLLISEFKQFIHRDKAGNPFILQCEPEGDYHPWQSFAYTIMAGVNPSDTIPGTEISLRQLATNSRYININRSQGHELGHLLYALSELEPNISDKPFWLKKDKCDINTLMQLAIEAHLYGSFEVCRKIHLTEGICAASATLSHFNQYRQKAQLFLNGQLDIIFLLGLAVNEAQECLSTNAFPAPHSLMHELRNDLMLADFLENHAFYIGHIIELATLAYGLGYEITDTHWNAMNFAVNKLNYILPIYLPYVSFEECFLHFGHYRRAITLLREVNSLRILGKKLERHHLQNYTTDFDQTIKIRSDQTKIAELLPIQSQLFDLAKPKGEARNRFLQVIAEYASSASEGLEPRGKFEHFRRIGPSSWPRSFHYEFLDYEDKIGIEIHLESEEAKELSDAVQHELPKIKLLFPGQPIEWDTKWYHEKGRLRILFDDITPTVTISKAMTTLIQNTFSGFDKIAKQLRVNSKGDVINMQ